MRKIAADKIRTNAVIRQGDDWPNKRTETPFRSLFARLRVL